MAEKNIKLVLSYDGTDFHGWQRQKTRISLQGTIEEALIKIFGTQINLTGCGRTDAKVHALNYVANFKIETRLSPPTITKALNANLPSSIVIKNAMIVSSDFHSRYDAKTKRYRYLITPHYSPFLEHYALYVRSTLNIDKMRQASKTLIGQHDFTSFRASGSSNTGTIRKVKTISFKEHKYLLEPDWNILSISIEANGFLYKMARNIVGTLLEIGKGILKPSQAKKILDAKDRGKAAATPPAHGLYLVRVKY